MCIYIFLYTTWTINQLAIHIYVTSSYDIVIIITYLLSYKKYSIFFSNTNSLKIFKKKNAFNKKASPRRLGHECRVQFHYLYILYGYCDTTTAAVVEEGLVQRYCTAFTE